MSIWKTAIMTIVIVSVPTLTVLGAMSRGNNSTKKKEKQEISGHWEKLEQETAYARNIMTTPRVLRKMRTENVVTSETTTNFAHIVFVGKSRSVTRNYTDYDVMFAWEREQGEYILSKVPVIICRFQLSEDPMEPMVKFDFDLNRGWGTHWTEVFIDPVKFISGDERGKLRSITFIINEKDWPTDINLPLND